MNLSGLLERAHERPLLTIVILGTALFLVTRLRLTEPAIETVPLTVSVDASADERDVEHATDEAILLAFAERAGFVHRDPAIRARLELNVRFADPSLQGDAAIDEAMRLGMHQSDPVVHARLLWLARETLADATRAEPADDVLDAYLRRNRARFARPEAITFEQVFVGRGRDDFEERVRLVAEAPSLELSDPSLLPARLDHASPRRVDARFGRGFADRLQGIEESEWTRVDSTYGAHFVRVLERAPGELPALGTIRTRVRHEWERDDRARRVREALRRMRVAYRIQVERS